MVPTLPKIKSAIDLRGDCVALHPALVQFTDITKGDNKHGRGGKAYSNGWSCTVIRTGSSEPCSSLSLYHQKQPYCGVGSG